MKAESLKKGLVATAIASRVAKAAQRAIPVITVAALSISPNLAFAVLGPITSADTVTVGDKVWAQVDLFSGLSWNQINSACPGGVCLAGANLNGYLVGGWTWASITDVAGLFSSVTPFPGGITVYTETASAWAPNWFDVIGFDPTDAFTGKRATYGITSTLTPTHLTSFLAAAIEDYAAISGGHSVDTVATDWLGAGLDESMPSFGAWLFMPADPASVREPGSFPLMGLALVGLYATSRTWRS